MIEQAGLDPFGQGAILDAAIGMAKGAGRTAVNLGRLVHRIPGVDALFGEIPADAESRLGLDPVNTAQRMGGHLEQAAEYIVPGTAAERGAIAIAARLAPKSRVVATRAARVLAGSGSSAATAEAQGGNVPMAAAMGAAGPLLGAASEAATPAIRDASERLVRAAVKPTITALRRIAGGRGEGLDAKATALVRFIIDHRLTTPEKAQTLIEESERELQRVLSLKNAPTDAPQRAARYLAALERSASKQGLPAEDVAQLRNATAELLQGPMGKDEIAMVLQPHPSLVDAAGKPILVLTPQTTRVLRTDVMADEALASAQSSSRWQTNKQWGEQKGTRIEAKKAVESAQRTAVKRAVPEAKPELAIQSQAIQARDVLDRMNARAQNRDVMSLPGAVVGAGQLAAGKVPILGLAANWLRDNQMRLGIWADRLSSAITRQDVREVSAILNRFGVGLVAQPSPGARP